MGATIQEHHGAWWLAVHHNGQRARQRFNTKKEAETARTLIAAQLLGTRLAGDTQPPPQALAESVAPPAAARTFAEYVITYLGKAERELKPSTYGDYDSALTVHLLPAFGDQPLTAITRKQVKFLTAKLRAKGLRAKTVKKIIGVLSVILSEALEDELIAAHPAEKMRRHYRSSDLKDAKTQIAPPDRATVAALLETARTHVIVRGGRPTHIADNGKRTTCRQCAETYPTTASHACRPYAASADFILFLARTGTRLGEALAIRWGDIDFVAKTARIEVNWVRRQLTTPKNHQQRTIDLSAQLVEALQARFAHTNRRVVGLTVDTEAALAEARAQALDRYVFGDGETPMDGDNFRKRVWEPLCVEAKVGKVRIHDLRHGYASQLIAAGKPIHYVQQQCGHHSPAFTLSEYGHLFPKDQHSNVDVLDDVQTPKATPPNARRRHQSRKHHSA